MNAHSQFVQDKYTHNKKLKGTIYFLAQKTDTTYIILEKLCYKERIFKSSKPNS